MPPIHRLAPLLLLAASACTSFSPPIRSPGYGAPGRLREGQLEIGGGVALPGGYGAGAGGPYVAYAVRDWANVEASADFAYQTWALGSLGGRFTHAPHRHKKLHYALDGEVGLGLGAGGHQACGEYSDTKEPCDGRPWYERMALGGYAGGGFGYHFAWFALFARLRLQGSVADGLAATGYAVAQGGMQFRIADRAALHGSVGGFGVRSARVAVDGDLYWDVGLSVYFDVRGRKQQTAHQGRDKPQQHPAHAGAWAGRLLYAGPWGI